MRQNEVDSNIDDDENTEKFQKWNRQFNKLGEKLVIIIFLSIVHFYFYYRTLTTPMELSDNLT
ncbi:unnamed protein product, partial [Ceratitis capitata]